MASEKKHQAQYICAKQIDVDETSQPDLLATSARLNYVHRELR